jgi:hypothetical protein
LRSPGATAFSQWLFSRHDLGRKLVAATGILLLGIGLGRMSVDAWNGHRRSTAYKELCEAAAANDRAAAGAAAERFLALTPPDVFDYRTLDVLEVRSDALLREISRAALTDRRADIERLMAESTALEERAKNEEETWRAIAEAQ